MRLDNKTKNLMWIFVIVIVFSAVVSLLLPKEEGEIRTEEQKICDEHPRDLNCKCVEKSWSWYRYGDYSYKMDKIGKDVSEVLNDIDLSYGIKDICEFNRIKYDGCIEKFNLDKNGTKIGEVCDIRIEAINAPCIDLRKKGGEYGGEINIVREEGEFDYYNYERDYECLKAIPW